MKSYHDLPLPSDEAKAHSLLLHDVIKQSIHKNNGLISFASFMEHALYHPQLGYYQQPQFSIGKTGDFTTAPEISPLFAHCFARQCLQIREASGTNNILELGAGSGRFALELLSMLDELHALPDQYYIYEISRSLQSAQRMLIQTSRPDLLERITWLNVLPSPFSGIVLANELLDAVPFERFQIQEQQPKQGMIGLTNDEFVWQWHTPDSPPLAAELNLIHQRHHLAEGYQSELALPAMTLLNQLCQSLKQGVILLADYGYGEREYYHPQRARGTMTCFYQHHAHQDPLLHPGLQDITTHIDFTRTAETAVATGMQLLGFTTQCGFLLANGLLQEAAQLEATMNERDAFHLHQAIKTLTLPTEMGETVKVMALGRGVDDVLNGFTIVDRRRDL